MTQTDEEIRQVDDFEIEITDLSPEEAPSVSSALVASGSRLLARMRPLRATKASVDTIEDEFSKEDAGIEITDLPLEEGRNVSAAFVALCARLSQTRNCRAVMLGIALLLALLVIMGSVPGLQNKALNMFTHPTPVPTTVQIETTSTDSSAVIGWSPDTWQINRTPGPVPQDCPPEGSVMNSGPYRVAFNNSAKTIHLFKDANPTPFGWVTLIHLKVKLGSTGPVTLSGGSINNSLPLTFDIGPYADPTSYLILDPQHPPLAPHQDSNQELSWKINMYIPDSGCYFLEASWPGGYWQISFAAGQ